MISVFGATDHGRPARMVIRHTMSTGLATQSRVEI